METSFNPLEAKGALSNNKTNENDWKNLSVETFEMNLDDTLDIDSIIASTNKKEFDFGKDIFFSSLLLN